MVNITSTETRNQIITMVREFVKRDVEPIANQYDDEDIYPAELVDKMAEMGLFGITLPEEYGGMGLDYTTFAMIFEELSKGWMSVSGVLGTHHILAYMLYAYGTDEQKQRMLPRMATGEIRAGLALTEESGGSDIQAIQTRATKDGEEYVINGRKMFISNGMYGNAFAVLTKTDPDADPPHRGMSCFIVEKPAEGFSVAQKLNKLGYRGIDTCELVFDNVRVPTENLIGAVEGQGFKHVMSALEGGRINVAARAVGVAQAAFDAAIKYAQQRETFGQPISEHQAIQL